VKIDDNLTASTYLRPTQTEGVRNEPPSPGGRGRAGSAGGEDSVAISSLGAEIARGLSQDSPEEITRISEAREAVQSGRINTEASELADSLIDAALTETSFESGLSRPAAV
jgi:anti-sigma28 factor (negative regulator of flagellin synthesis)